MKHATLLCNVVSETIALLVHTNNSSTIKPCAFVNSTISSSIIYKIHFPWNILPYYIVLRNQLETNALLYANFAQLLAPRKFQTWLSKQESNRKAICITVFVTDLTILAPNWRTNDRIMRSTAWWPFPEQTQ